MKSIRKTTPTWDFAGVLVAVLLLLLATVANTVVSLRATHKLIDSSNWVEHTRIVLDELDGISLSLVSAETAERGYLYTGDRHFLAPYAAASRAIDNQVNHLAALTRDNAVQQQQIPSLKLQVATRMGLLKQVIALQDAGESARAKELVLRGGGKQAMQAVQNLVAAMKNEELRLLAARSSDSQRSARFLLTALPIANGVTAVLIGLAGLLLAREFHRRTRLAAHLRELVHRERTARAEAEAAKQALIQNEKLAAVGRLAATIAHEINNPLECVTNLIYLTKMESSLDEIALSNLTLADAELKRVAHITKQTLGFYRETSKPASVNLKEIIDDVLGLYASRIENKGIRVHREYNNDTLYGFAGGLRQIFSNLLLNAIDAVGMNGVITVRTSHSRNGNQIRVTIADNGSGIPRQHLTNIFEPFFTTKAHTGTGLGLWVSKQIVEKHGGQISVRSTTRPRRSYTAFRISLPSAMSPNAAAG